MARLFVPQKTVLSTTLRKSIQYNLQNVFRMEDYRRG
jgi:hypothetical protein